MGCLSFIFSSHLKFVLVLVRTERLHLKSSLNINKCAHRASILYAKVVSCRAQTKTTSGPFRNVRRYVTNLMYNNTYPFICLGREFITSCLLIILIAAFSPSRIPAMSPHFSRAAEREFLRSLPGCTSGIFHSVTSIPARNSSLIGRKNDANRSQRSG